MEPYCVVVIDFIQPERAFLIFLVPPRRGGCKNAPLLSFSKIKSHPLGAFASERIRESICVFIPVRE